MTEDAYANLKEQGFSDGDKVSTFAGFVAVIQTVMENPKFDPIHMALITPNKNDGGTILKGYTHLGSARQDLIDVLTSFRRAADVDLVLTDGTAGEGYVSASDGALKLVGEPLGTEDRNNEEDGVGSRCPRFEHLRALQHEVLSQHGDGDGLSYCNEIIKRSVEVVRLRQHADRGCP